MVGTSVVWGRLASDDVRPPADAVECTMASPPGRARRVVRRTHGERLPRASADAALANDHHGERCVTLIERMSNRYKYSTRDAIQANSAQWTSIRSEDIAAVPQLITVERHNEKDNPVSRRGPMVEPHLLGRPSVMEKADGGVARSPQTVNISLDGPPWSNFSLS